ncbi:hypothetical protein STCU_11334 [Strigomonas culicis]|uniref:Uncharacterized protein n=1 Tax=Strigomonas culicis TaxID=28005 RepID=S9TE97_9TRYP|nr:hypothetical protein STCU_11334 [Strigomonas culicis]|eukprot:EPY16382.1 hypothetical protein STCU_11334 [Strigomonas culicis]
MTHADAGTLLFVDPPRRGAPGESAPPTAQPRSTARWPAAPRGSTPWGCARGRSCSSRSIMKTSTDSSCASASRPCLPSAARRSEKRRERHESGVPSQGKEEEKGSRAFFLSVFRLSVSIPNC